MIRKISEFLLHYITKDQGYSEIQQEQMLYSLKSIFNDLSKFMLLFMIALLLGYGNVFIVGYIMTLILRIHIGGYHCSTYMSCLSVTSIFFIVLIFFYKILLSRVVLLTLSLLTSIWLVYQGPLPSSQRMNMGIKKKKVLKWKILCILLLYHIGYLFLPFHTMKLGLGTIILQTLLILFIKIFDYKRGKIMLSKLKHHICKTLLSMAPFLSLNTASGGTWGEEDIPKSLKNINHD